MSIFWLCMNAHSDKKKHTCEDIGLPNAVPCKGPSTLATLFSHMWPRIVADPSTLGRHVVATCMLCMQTLCLWRGRATVCRTLEPQTAVCSPKLKNNGFLRE